MATAAPGSSGCSAGSSTTPTALRVGGPDDALRRRGGPARRRQQVELGPDAWRGTVQLTYRYDGLDKAPARMETDVAFVPDGQRGRGSPPSAAADARTPLWLADRLERRTHAAERWSPSRPRRPGRYPALVAGAVRQVARVLPDWKGPLLVEVPESQRGARTPRSQAQPGEYDNIAAVTTTADGSLAPDAPVRVFVNPTVFGRLKERGAQVVMSHESHPRGDRRDVRVDADLAARGVRRLRGPRPCRRAGRPRGRADPRRGSARRACPTGCPPARTSTRPRTVSARPTRRPGSRAASWRQEYGEHGAGALLPHRQRRGLDAGGVPHACCSTTQREFVAALAR